MRKISKHIVVIVIILVTILYVGNYSKQIKGKDGTYSKGWTKAYSKKINSLWNAQYSVIKMTQNKIPLLVVFKYSGKNNKYNAIFYKYKKGTAKRLGKFTVSMYDWEHLYDFTDNFYRKGRTIIYKQFGGDGTIYRVIRYSQGKIRVVSYMDNVGMGYHTYYRNYKRISKSKFNKAIKGYKKLNIK